jgi:hypothetical protein
MIEPDINEQMARFAPSQNPADPGFDAIEKAVAGMSGVPMPKPEPVDMDIDRAVQDIAAQRRQDMASSLMAASEVNPDEAAQADALGRRFGVGQDIALRNMSEMRRQAMIQDTERMDLLRKDPVLARYIADREFAAQASDDVGVLSMLRPMVLEAATLQTPGGFFRVVGRGYERGQAAKELGDIGAKTFFGFAEQGDLDRAKQLQERMQQLGQQGLLGSTAEMIAQNVGQLRTIGTTAAGGAAIGSFFGPPGLVIGGGLGAAAGIVIGTGTMEAGNLYLDMRDQGVSDDAAIPAAIAGGFLNGVIEVVGMKIASAPFKALASKVIREEVSKAIAQPTMRSALIAAGKAYGLQVGGEAAEEGLQEIVAIASEEIAKAADGIDSETSLREATGRVIEAFAYGGMASALLGGIGPGANLVVDLRRANATQRQQAFFDGLVENRKESRLAQRNPQGYERFLAAQAQDTPAETIYVDAATARDVLAQSGTTTAQLEDILPGIRERLEKAVETGGDVTIPTSQFGARLANTELGNALLPHMRLSPEAMSATEAQAFEAQRQAVVEEARTILATKQEADAAFVAEAQQVEDEAFEQVRAVGQFTDIEARTIAKLRQAMVVVDAAEAGMTPAQYQRERGVPLQVRGVQGEVAPAAPMEQPDQFDQAGQRRTDTPAFRSWFGESKAVTETGTPLLMYRGAYEKIVEPRVMTSGGIFITPSRDLANAYGDEIMEVFVSVQKPLDVSQAKTMSLRQWKKFLATRGVDVSEIVFDSSLGNKYSDPGVDQLAGGAETAGGTIRYNFYELLGENDRWNGDGNLREELQRQGFDGVISQPETASTVDTPQPVWIVWNGNQLKSPNNRGTFSRATANIMEQAATLDADYLAAVERGDMEAAQRMVDEAARAAGYNSPRLYKAMPSVDVEGRPITTIQRQSEFPAFNRGEAGIRIAGFFAEDRTVADRFTAMTEPPAPVYETYLREDNPYVIDAAGRMAGDVQFGPSGMEFREAVRGGKYDSIIIRNTADEGTIHVALDPSKIKSADPVTRDEAGNVVPLSRRFDITSPKLFEQAMPSPGPARGGFDPRTLNVLVGKGGDVSTLAHELIHLRVAEYLRMARGTTPPARVNADLETLFGFMGVEGATFQERLDNYETMTIDQRRPLEEKVTYNFEIYLYEGKAPSVELRGVFDRLAAWMRRVYKSIRDDLNAIYRREFGTDLPILTPEVRSVFDRMLASEEQIKRQEAIEGMKGLFQTQAESGMDDAQWAAFQAMQQEATDAAVTDLNTASMRQLQWLGNARARILRDLQKKHDAKRKEVTAEVAAAVKVEPVYRAMTYLRYGRFVDTDGAEVEVEGTHRLDIEKVRAMYASLPSAEGVELIRATGMAVPANVRPDITPLGTGKYGMLGRDGLDPDVVAETFGYSSGDEMVRALLAAKPMKDAVAERTDAEMLRRYGDMNTPAALEAEVQKALHNEARARFVAVELRHIAKATQPVRVMLEAAKQVAADMISDMTVRDVRPSEFVAAEARAARDATQINSSRDPVAAGKAAYTRAYNEAAAVGAPEDVRVAGALAAQADAVQKAQARIDELRKRYGADPQQALIRAKRAQLYQNQLAAEALRVKEYVDKQVKYLRGVMRDSNVKRMGAAAADQVAGLLERFEVAPVSLKRLEERRSMAQFLADLEAAGVVPDIAEEIANEARRVNYKQLKVSEFRDLVDAVRQIEHIGKNEQKMRLAEERAAFEEVRDDVVTRIRAVGKVRELQIDPRTPLTGIGRTAAFLRGFAAQHLKAASIVRILDGGKDDGPLWNAIIRTANEAADFETRRLAEASLKFGEILKPVFALGGMGGKGMYFPSINRSLNREARIAIASNMGNDGNRQRLLDGEGWTLEQLQPVLESLTEAEWLAVQQMWNFIDGYRPEIAAKELRLYGKEPEWVKPTPFIVRTSDGKEVALQGGYYPVKYDPVASDRVATVDAAEEAKRDLQGAYTAATTRRSFVKARAKEVRDRPLLYTLDAAFSGVNDVIHDLAWHEWLISTNRLLRDPKFANAVRETRGPEFLKQLRDWTKDNATGARGQPVYGEGALSWLRQGISASGLGFNVVSAAMQVTGFNQSIVRVGAKYIGQGIVQFSTSPFESAKTVAEKSSFMAERGRTQFREINEIKNRVRGQTEVARRVTAGTYFLMMNMQRSVDIPTWLGAYQKALDAGKDDAKAVALADQAVRDSQGSGLVSDLAAIERGGPVMKLFTVFYSYMNTVYNMTAVQTMTARGKGKLAADYAMLLVVPVVLGYAIKSVIQPDAGDDELDPEALARKLAAEELSYLMGTMVIAREFGGAAQLLTGAEGVRMGYGGPAGLRAVGEVYGLATQAGQLEFDRAFRRAAINTLGAFTGLPSAQINRTIDGIEALVEGEVEGPSAVLAPLTGVQR